MQIKNPFRGWQHAVAGTVVGIFAGKNDTVNIPTERLTTMGIYIMIPAISIFGIIS